MKFDALYEELMEEASGTKDNEPLFRRALEVLLALKKKDPAAYDKVLQRINDITSYKPTKSIQLSSDPEDSSWVPSLNK